MRWLQRFLRVSLAGLAVACAKLPAPVPSPAPTGSAAGSGVGAAAGAASAGPPGRADTSRAPDGARAGRPAPPDALTPEGRRSGPRPGFDVNGLPTMRPSATGRMLAPAEPGKLPPIPSVDGELAVRVIYPQPRQVISVRDSTFIFGSLGSGLAHLTVNGDDVPVNANGSFLAWLPFPPGESPRYEIVATKDGTTARATLDVARPRTPTPLPETGRLVVDRESLLPDTGLRLRGNEMVRVGIRAPAKAHVTLRLAAAGARPLVSNGSSQSYHIEIPARLLAKPARMTVARGRESIAIAIPAVRIVDAEAPEFVELKNSDVDAKNDTDAVTIVRPTPGGTYKWLLQPGTIVETTGRRGAWTRIRLDDQLEAWVETRHTAPSDRTARGRHTAMNARVVTAGSNEGWTDVRIPIGERTPFLVEETRDALVLTLYNTESAIDIINYASADPSVRDVTWDQVASDRVRVTVHLRHAPFGYLALWDHGTFVLRVRHPPAVDPARPLAGRVIAVDAGHPPIGATGPTGLYEGDVTLAVAQALKPMLEKEGATVVMTRTTPGPVALGARPIIARRADADVLVSIHLNAHPDGVNPYRTNGSGTYFFNDQAEPLARAVQRGLVRWMGLRDLGVNYDNLALARPTWMPSILCEGAFVILPDQEAALRTSEFQSRYAIGILEGLESYFRTLPSRTNP